MTTVVTAGKLGHVDEIALRIQRILELRGWTARELARQSGLPSETHVGLILKRGGARVGVETLLKLAQAAQVSERWLLTGQGSPDESDEDRAPSHSESEIPHLSNAVGWDDALATARVLEPELFARASPLALERAAGAGAWLTGEAATPQLVIDAVRMALRYESMQASGDLDRRRQEARERVERLRAEGEKPPLPPEKPGRKKGPGK